MTISRAESARDRNPYFLDEHEEDAIQQYRQTADKILEKLEAQFKKALKVINETQNSEYRISAEERSPPSRKGGFNAKEIKSRLPVYGLSISCPPAGAPQDTNRAPLLYLGDFAIYPDLPKKLEEMVEDQNVPEFDHVYEYWLKKLRNQLKFCEENTPAILETKKKVCGEFAKAVWDTKIFAAEKGYYPISIQPERPSEPLKTYWVRKQISDRESECCGGVSPLKSLKDFKRLVRDPSEMAAYDGFQKNSAELIDKITKNRFHKELPSVWKIVYYHMWKGELPHPSEMR